jgi:hypothetical protein
MEPVFRIYSFEEITTGSHPILPKKPTEIKEPVDEGTVGRPIIKSPQVDHTYTLLHYDLFENIPALSYPKHNLNNEELGLFFSFLKSNTLIEAAQIINGVIQTFFNRCTSAEEDSIPYLTFVTEIEPKLKKNIWNFKKEIRMGKKFILEQNQLKESPELRYSPILKEITTVAKVIYNND